MSKLLIASVLTLAIAAPTQAKDAEPITSAVQWHFPILILAENGDIKLHYSSIDKRIVQHEIVVCFTNYERESTFWRCALKPENGNVKLATLKVGDGI